MLPRDDIVGGALALEREPGSKVFHRGIAGVTCIGVCAGRWVPRLLVLGLAHRSIHLPVCGSKGPPVVLYRGPLGGRGTVGAGCVEGGGAVPAAWKPLLMLPLRKRRAGLLHLARAAKDQQELRVGEFRAPAAGARKRNSYFFYPLCTHRKRKGCVLARLSLGWCVSIFPSLVPSLGFSVFFLSFWSFFFLSALITRSCSCSGRNPVLLPRPRATAHASFWFVLFIYYSR